MKKGLKSFSPQNNLIHVSEGNEENGYPVPDSYKDRLQNKDKLQQGIPRNPQEHCERRNPVVVTENLMDMLLDTVNQNVKEALKKFQDTKNKKYEKTQKQINELIGTLNKHQSKTKNMINTEINEIKMKIDNIKEEVTHDMGNLRK
jgi:molecular chaperone DnaK (HSP70)